MNDIDIMEQNLARLLSEHLSLPSAESTEPADPFQKRTFGRKMRKSTVSILDEQRCASLGKLDGFAVRSVQQLRQIGPVQAELVDEEGEMYLREIEVLMARLRVGMEKVEQNCREKLEQIVRSDTGRQRQQKAESILSEIQTSVHFIINDCFSFQHKTKDKENRHDRGNRQPREMKEQRDVKEVKEMRQCREMRENRKSSTGNSRSKAHQKSIYQCVLQERKMRLSKKRMI